MTYSEMYNMHPKKTAKPVDKNNDGTTTYTEKIEVPIYNSEDDAQPETPKQEINPTFDKDGDGVVTYKEFSGEPTYIEADKNNDANEDETVVYNEEINVQVSSKGTDGVDANGDGTISYAETAGITEPEITE